MDTQRVPPPREFPIPADFHVNIRNKFLTAFRAEVRDNAKGAVLLFKGAVNIPIHDDDQNYQVCQESNFHYLFGVAELDCYAILEPDTGRTVLFTPRVPETYKMWMVVLSNKEIQDTYKLDEVIYVDEMEAYLKMKKPTTIYYYKGEDADSKTVLSQPEFPFLAEYHSNHDDLFTILNESRVIKTPQEIDVMRYICKLSSEAHCNVMRKIRGGNKEYQIEALFRYHVLSNSGCRFQPYDCICAAGNNGATLHYVVNDSDIKDDQFVLCDMGGKYYGYCSDITVTFPSNGKFNEHQKVVYNAVLDAQQQVHKNLKPGTNWGDLHMLAERVIAKHLLVAGVLKGDLDEINQNRIGNLFFPHGLGHLLGLKTHDVGGYNKGCPPRLPELSNLRFRRDLQVGMVFTNEPGCYFIDFILEEAFKNPEKVKYLNMDKIKEYRQIGGVRLEDDLVLNADGPEILNDVPRTIEQIELCMQGLNWKQ